MKLGSLGQVIDSAEQPEPGSEYVGFERLRSLLGCRRCGPCVEPDWLRKNCNEPAWLRTTKWRAGSSYLQLSEDSKPDTIVRMSDQAAYDQPDGL